MKGRYIFCPMTSKKLGHRTTLMERIRRRRIMKKMAPDIFRIVDYYPAIYPSKK